jgi:hypothetical protein
MNESANQIEFLQAECAELRGLFLVSQGFLRKVVSNFMAMKFYLTLPENLDRLMDERLNRFSRAASPQRDEDFEAWCADKFGAPYRAIQGSAVEELLRRQFEYQFGDRQADDPYEDWNEDWYEELCDIDSLQAERDMLRVAVEHQAVMLRAAFSNMIVMKEAAIQGWGPGLDRLLQAMLRRCDSLDDYHDLLSDEREATEVQASN